MNTADTATTMTPHVFPRPITWSGQLFDRTYYAHTRLDAWRQHNADVTADYLRWYGYGERFGPDTVRPVRPMTVYRGATAETSLGVWWTPIRGVAEMYASMRQGEGLPARVFRVTVSPDLVMHCADETNQEFYVHPDALTRESVDTVPHKGPRVPGLEAEQTARWIEVRDQEFDHLARQYGAPGLAEERRANLPANALQLYRGATPATWDGAYWTTSRVEAKDHAAACTRGGWEGRIYSAMVPVSAIFHGPDSNYTVAVRPQALDPEQVVSELLPA